MVWTHALLLVLVMVVGNINTSNEVVASDSDVTISFPEGATITSRFPAESITDDGVSLVWTPRGTETNHISTAIMQPALNGVVEATVTLNAQQDFIPAGLTIEYQWVTGASPFVSISEKASFDWIDTRWEWSTASEGAISVNTYGRDSIDADTVLSSATETLETMRSEYGIGLSDPISIWVYPNMTDFTGTMQSNAREAIAGVAYPEYGVISAILPASQPAELDRVIPHEISHQVLYQATDNPWNEPPLWFDEGMAVYLQTGGTASYELILDRTLQEGTFYGLDALSYNFPYNPADASLAYAQSWSIVSWLHETHGADGVARLINAFGSGSSWDAAVQSALGVDIESLETQWREWLEAQVHLSDARLFTETHRRDLNLGMVSSRMATQQEIHEWPLKRNSTAHEFSIRLRSNENSRSTISMSMQTARTSASSIIRSASHAFDNSASTAVRLPATPLRKMAPCSFPMRAV